MTIPGDLKVAWAARDVIPYLGPGVLGLDPACPLPETPEGLAARLTEKVTVPHKIRGNLTAAAQFIENFKHRKTVDTLMKGAFAAHAEPNALHHWIAESVPPLVVHAWYDDLLRLALARKRRDWGLVQAVSQAEHYGQWVHYFRDDGTRAGPGDEGGWTTLAYEPLGAVYPAGNFLVSDSDFVEVLTEIDIQTPIPPRVQELRARRGFLFLGCRFKTQLERAFARQIMKRSQGPHWAVLPGDATRNESRFLAEQQITVITSGLSAFLGDMAGAGAGNRARAAS
ncbi:SIR2 family protein [Acidiferrobacter sp.]|uniref:SIR2 family NAD-dependent protein deacylase n=1 Tax=Acidiferrobacter sp. TaxID=1872107 RepID=UPI00262F4889|nr:SIR2 family protein [Acidiferrobacter sp.]